MIITTLVENTTISKEYKSNHGLCIHIKMENKNILFDLGPDDTFLKNATKLNIDIKDVDIVIISHGHKDHGGGLKAFLEYNEKAKIYISKYAFKDYYASVLKYIKVYVGLNRSIKDNQRIILTDEIYSISDKITLISNISGDVLLPEGNKNLLIKENKTYSLDRFKHEQHLILKDGGKNILISGCSHGGIINILENIEERLKFKIEFIVGGLHLHNPLKKKTENSTFINELGNRLIHKKVKLYTCHCTGEKAFNLLNNILVHNIEAIKTGQVI